MSGDTKRSAHFGRYLFLGFITVAPLWVTWLVFDFVLRLLAGMGVPVLRAAALAIAPMSPTLSAWLRDTDFQWLVAVVFTLLTLYLIGLAASLVLGRRLIGLMDGLINRLPLVQTIYGGTKRFLQAISTPPVSGQRVVLISFPTPEMKAVGFVTKVIRAADTGEDLAVVYVPTSPNPTSGYIEIVPLEQVVQTDWTIEEAMSFVVTGGANAPDRVRFDLDRPDRTA